MISLTYPAARSAQVQAQAQAQAQVQVQVLAGVGAGWHLRNSPCHFRLCPIHTDENAIGANRDDMKEAT
jgi:hypothetical protein